MLAERFDTIIKQMMKDRKEKIQSVNREIDIQTSCYGVKPSLKETFDNIIKIDPEYVRKYLAASSNIAFQKDFVIDDINRLRYNSAAFNNDSVYLNFGGGDKILLVCTDVSLTSDNYNFYSDIFVDGVKLRKEKYIELPSTKHYNFKTGARRFLIDTDAVSVGSIVSIVIRKEPRCKSFYTTVKISTPNKKTYLVSKSAVGRYGEIFDCHDNDLTSMDNLLVFKKKANENFFKLDKNAYIKEYLENSETNIKGTISPSLQTSTLTSLPTVDVVKGDAYRVVTNGTYNGFECKKGDILYALETIYESDDLNWAQIPFNIQKSYFILDLSNENIEVNDVYLVINKTKHLECEHRVFSELTEEEYLVNDVASLNMTIKLVDENITVEDCSLPLPVSSINDVEVYVNGYRAINNVDFFFVNDDGEQRINFVSPLSNNSIVTYRNKNIDNAYNFYKRANLTPDIDLIVCNEAYDELIELGKGSNPAEGIPELYEPFDVNGVSVVPYSDDYEEYRDSLTFLEDSSISYGFIDLSDGLDPESDLVRKLELIPICGDYIEAYLGRIRIPKEKKRDILNRYLKIDDQHSTFENLEVYTEINYTEYAKTAIELLDAAEVSKNIYAQLKDMDSESFKKRWLETVNAVSVNDTTVAPTNIFARRIERISFNTALSGQQLKQYSYPNLKVLGFYDSESTSAGVDITNMCEYTFRDSDNNILPDFNPELIGDQNVTATFRTSNAELTDSIVIKIVDLELETLNIVTSSNFFTTEDNILNDIRVIGVYENGTEKFVTDDCTITLTDAGNNIYEGGTVTDPGIYIVNVTCGTLTSSKTVSVSTPEGKVVKHVDVIPTAHEVNGNITTDLTVYATFNNGKIQRIEEDTVSVMLEKNGNFVNSVTTNNADLNTDGVTYNLRVYIYTNSDKTDLIKTPAAADYTEVSIRILSNNIKNRHQFVYFKNFTATLDTRFVIEHRSDPDYGSYVIKNLDGVYMTIGQTNLNSADGAITIGPAENNEMVCVEFYNRLTNEVTNQLLFSVMGANQPTCTGSLDGNIVDGYEVAIEKIKLNEEYDNIDLTDAKLIDTNGNIVVDFVANEYNQIRNSGNGYIYIYFADFRTRDGSVAAIFNYLSNNISESTELFFDIPRIGKSVELELSENYQYNATKITNYTATIQHTEDERWIEIVPDLPDEDFVSYYELRPNNKERQELTDSIIRYQLSDTSGNGYEVLLNTSRCGLNRYCYVTIDNDIYYIDITINNEHSKVILDNVNGSDIVVD